MLKLPSKRFRGDTIVEVLLAIAIAAFAIAITFATAQRSLNQSITAREHNEALNLIENQVTDLRLRFAKSSSPADFNANFGNGTTHFCLDNTAVVPTDANWGPYTNYNDPVTDYEATNLANSSAPTATSPYYTPCVYQKAGDGVIYYIDIKAKALASPITNNPNVYQVLVRWQRAGGGQVNQASVFFRPDGFASQTLGYALPNSLVKLYSYRGTTYAS
ncbi:MAG TPA: hypothetical protein VFH37_02935 [Candidatus Saccharimonadales bacterium]|nr:hypothetical protein [Candidatus Saccharimonadales bacterium]